MWSLVTVGTTACHAISNAPGHLRLFSRRAHAFNTAWVMPTRVRDLRYQGSPECPHAEIFKHLHRCVCLGNKK